MAYLNPVLDQDFPDPSVLLAPDGFYYAYATQTRLPSRQIVNMQVARSPDLVRWDHLGDCLPVKPVWAATSQRFWAPHVVGDPAMPGRYLMYYSAQPNDPQAGLALAVATADSPAGPFHDVGAPLLPTPGPGFEHIDPMRYDDPATGRAWLFYGSGFGPLRARELARDGLSFAPGADTIVVLPAHPEDPHSYGRLIEASWVIHRQGWYYLFYSGDNCCGASAHYALLVARSRDLPGPYQTLGQAEGGAGAILEANDRWLAPGHHCLITDGAGTDWLLYHAIDRRQPTFNAINAEQGYSRRVLLLDRLAYVDGWPRVAGGSPSTTPQTPPAAMVNEQ